jgi:hypothetical protein
MLFSVVATDGKINPPATPTAIARKIQSVRNLSRNDNFALLLFMFSLRIIKNRRAIIKSVALADLRILIALI